jgi:hypothetical protein
MKVTFEHVVILEIMTPTYASWDLVGMGGLPPEAEGFALAEGRGATEWDGRSGRPLPEGRGGSAGSDGRGRWLNVGRGAREKLGTGGRPPVGLGTPDGSLGTTSS